MITKKKRTATPQWTKESVLKLPLEETITPQTHFVPFPPTTPASAQLDVVQSCLKVFFETIISMWKKKKSKTRF